MTEKRFMIDDCGTLIDTHTRNTYDYVTDIVNLLNNLHESREYYKKERNKLKQELNECEKFRYQIFKRISELSDKND